MANTIKRTFSSISSPNDLGYVDLPREAVLNNTVSPAEQRAFAAIAFIPFIIPAAFFAPEATLLAAVLAGCGSRGGSEEPILTSGGFDGQGEISPDVGTTDEGDTGIAADDGLADDGMTIADEVVLQDSQNDQDATPDDGGISQPDDGMSLADEVALQDSVNDQDATPGDGDALIAADNDGMSKPDDGITIADIIAVDTQDGVAPDQDATPDTPDVTIIADSGDTAIGDDSVPTADVIAPQDLAPDGTADQSDATKDTDTVPDIAPPCTPSCVPVANTISCEDGSTNVAVSYFVKCATQFACDGIDTAKASVNLSDPNIETTQTVTVAQCVDSVIFGACQAINANNTLSELCGDVTIKTIAKPKPNTPPEVNQLTGPADKSIGILPGGDQCFGAANNIGFSFTASDKDNNPLTCSLKIYQNGSLVPAATVSATFNDLTKPLTLQLSANLLQPRTDYCWNTSCDDGKGGVALAGGNACFTTSEKGLIGWWRFDEGQGNIAKDSSGNGVDGTLTDFDDLTKAWVKIPTGGGLFFDGIKNHILTNSPPEWDNLNALSVMATFSNAFPLHPNATLIHKGGDKNNIWALQFLSDKTLRFMTCTKSIACINGSWPKSKYAFTDNAYHTVTSMYDGTQSNIYTDGVLENQILYVPAGGPIITASKFVIGGWYNYSDNFYHGTIDDIRIYNNLTENACK